MPQLEIRARKPSAKQKVLDKGKKKAVQPNPKSRSKKKQAKKQVEDSSGEESQSDDENQPRKRQKVYQDPEEVSVAENTSEEEEPEVIPVSDTSGAEDNTQLEVDDAETVESVDNNVLVRLEFN